MSKLKTVLYVPDQHFPYNDKRYWKLLLKVGRAIKPDIIVTLGDLGDFLCTNQHPKNPNRTRDLEVEVASVNEGLDDLDSLGAAEKIFVAGNHENNLERFLQEHAPQLFNMVKVEKLLRLKERGWKYVPYKEHIRLGKVYITHDTGSSGATAHTKSALKFGGNAVIGHCLPADYEVLTSTRGFVKLSEITYFDRALCFDKGRVVESMIHDIVNWKYTGEMACFDNQDIAMEMTDRHHVYTKDGRYLPIREALDTVSRDDLVREAEPIDAPEFPIADDMLRLVVAYAADGYRASPGSLRFHLKKPRKISRLTEIVTNLGSSIAWSTPSKTGSVKTKKLSRSLRREVIQLVPDKRLPEWLKNLSARQRKIVIDELPEWDGSHIVHDGVDYHCKQFQSFKKEERDLVQFLLLQGGTRSSQTGNVVTYRSELGPVRTTRPLRDFVQWKPVENLEVGCITTNYQNFFVRTPAGRVELSGNTHRCSVTYSRTITGKGHVAAMFGWGGDFNYAMSYMHRAQMTDWSLGFGIGKLAPNGHQYLQACPVVDYRVLVDGKLYTA